VRAQNSTDLGSLSCATWIPPHFVEEDYKVMLLLSTGLVTSLSVNTVRLAASQPASQPAS